MLAVVVGLFTGVVILLFRASIETLLGLWILPDGSESFEALLLAERFALPVFGAAIIGLTLTRMDPGERRVGVVHVMERLSRHQGYLPVKNAVVQFFGGILALVTGQSGGREGPAVHLGAASASLLGQAMNLPNNSIRVLVACGVAAAIAGSFNTPLAGVIFAMEVVMMEYTLGSFIPVIIASVVTTVMSQFFFGQQPAFSITAQNMSSLMELPYILLAGLIVGCVASAFISTVQAFARLTRLPFWTRALLAGVLTGLAALVAPEVMGIGYDTVSEAMLGQIALGGLLMIVVLKIITSGAAVGLGMPVGLIGPTFVVGAALGGVLGYLGNYLQPGAGVSVALYVMLGMTAMMAAVLQAPLAALMAVLELTANPSLMLPAMLIIVVATLTTSVLFGQKSVFLSTLDTLGLKYPPDPVTAHLQRAGVASIMNRALVRLEERPTLEAARTAMTQQPLWVVVESTPGEIRCVLRASDLRVYLQKLAEQELAEQKLTERNAEPEAGEHEEQGQEQQEREQEGEEVAVVDLLEIPGQRLDAANLDHRANLAEAQTALNEPQIEVLCVRRTAAPMIESVIGIITQQDIDSYREPVA
ncbi:MAG: chloride channel protein [Pseudomonadota bacterium]